MAEDARTSLTIDDVLLENDDFRLAIRGFAVIEDSIAAGIAEAFEGGKLPGELKRLPFRARLALFMAVTGIPEESVKPLIALAKLRNDFAHGRMNSMTRHRANSLADEFGKVFQKSGPDFFAKAETPHGTLGRCLFVGDIIVDEGRRRIRKRRDQEQKALKLQADLKKRLLDEG